MAEQINGIKPDFAACEQQKSKSAVHLGNLINAFVIRFLLNGVMYLTLATRKLPIVWLVSVAEQTGLNLTFPRWDPFQNLPILPNRANSYT